MVRKQLRQRIAYRFRHLGLGAKELWEKKKLTKSLKNVSTLLLLCDNQEDEDDLEFIELLVLDKLAKLLILRNLPVHAPIDRLPRNLAFMQQHYYNECEILFRFRYEYLERLFNTLGLPADCVLENGSRMSGEEIFLFSLCRLSYPNRLVTMRDEIWGGEESVWSRVFKYFNLFVYNIHGHRLTNYLGYWKQHFPSMASAVKRKLEEFGVVYGENEVQPVCCFIDDLVKEACRPGAGPNGRRYEEMNALQRAYYSGWKCCHCVVWQTIDSPHGMVMDIFGPGAGRHNDLWRLRESGINQRMAAAQLGDPFQYCMFGDCIFLAKSHLLVKHDGEFYVLTQREEQENYARPRARVAIEWDYNTTARLFPYVDYNTNCKVLAGGSNMALAYFTAVLLKNCHVCLYHSESSSYFAIEPPTLEHYMA